MFRCSWSTAPTIRFSPSRRRKSQCYQRLGTVPAQKRHVVFKSGHAVTVPEVRNDLVREVLAWFDNYLGKT